MKNKLILGGTILANFFVAQFALAAAVCRVNGKEVPCGEFPWWIFIVVFVVGILAFIFWLRMLIHAAKSTDPSKVAWIILIVFTNLLGAIIYYFAAKKSAVPPQVV